MNAIEVRALPLSLVCCVPVSEAGETLRDGEPLPLDQRRELCALDAPWLVGIAPVCDEHLRMTCEIGGVDFDLVVRNCGRQVEEARQPRRVRARQTQEEARRALGMIEKGERK